MSIAVAVIPGVTISRRVISPPVSCPNPDDFLIIDFSNRDLLTFADPTSGSLALRGSGRELSLPDPPYRIVVYVQPVFYRIKFSVRNSELITTTFTDDVGNEMTTRQATPTEAVSLYFSERVNS